MRKKILRNIQASFRRNCYVLCLVGFFSQAQHDDLLNIIGSDETNEIKQLQIDSFFIANEKVLSSELLADNYHEVAKFYYNNWWDTSAETDITYAIDYTSKSLDIKKELPLLEEGSLEKTAFNLGTFYYYNGDIYNAREAYRFLVDKGRDTESIQDAKLEIGSLCTQLGDYYKALDQFRDIITYYTTSTSENTDSFNLLDAYITRAETFYLINNREFDAEIRSDLEKADSLIEKANQADVHFRKNRINQFKGNRFLEFENYDQAIVYHKSVLADSLNLYPAELSRVYNSIAFSQIKLKNFNQALTALNQAIVKDENYSAPYENLGDLYFSENDYEKGLYQYQKAILFATDKSRKINYDDMPLAQNFELASNKVLLLNHIVTKANGWLQYYEFDKNKKHLEHALETFTIADQLVDIIRFESTETQSKLFWREKGSSLYMKAVEASYLLNKPNEAYYFMERNKALLLLEDVSNEQAKEIAQLPDSVAKREFDLKRSILLAENQLQIAADASTEEAKELRDKIYGHKRVYDQFAATLTKTYPDYANLKKKVDVLPYVKFKTEHVSENEVVLQYILNDESGYGLLSTVNQTHFFKLENSRLLNQQLLTLYAQLTDMTSSREKMATYNKTANDVFHTLIPKDVYSAIKGKKLTLVADNILQQIPFEALVVDLEHRTYLIEEVEIRYAYSISYLSAKKEIEQKPEKALLGLAPIQFTTLGLPQLDFSGEEINEVHKIYSGEMALNGDATKSRLLDGMNNFRILHLSTHADVGEGSNPWIAFTDEKLFLNEIYATKNQAEMVVLSGCNTSLGELKKGEGAMSLARGFFHSGAKSVVSSLWTINDKSSKDLMTNFYKGLDKGLTKAAALREAKIAYISKFRGTTVSPSFWAALIVIGDNSPINTSGLINSTWLWALLGSVLLLGAGLFYYRKRVF